MHERMTDPRKYVIVSFLILLWPVMTARGQGRGGAVEAGGLFSTKGCGVALVFPRPDGTAAELRLLSDFAQVLRGHEYYPGAKLQYLYRLRVQERTVSDELSVRLTAGPGLTVGAVRDHGKGDGLLAALCGNITADFQFSKVPVTVSAGLSADLGAHLVFKEWHESTMTLYRNGLRKVWQPEISIRYRF